MEIKRQRFIPSSGKVVSLPSNIGRKDIGRFGGGAAGNGQLKVAVVGHGDLEEHVVLKASEGNAEIPEGAEVLGTDLASGDLYYAIPREAYDA